MALTERRRIRQHAPWRSRLALHGFELLATINAAHSIAEVVQTTLVELCTQIGVPRGTLCALGPQAATPSIVHSVEAEPHQPCVAPGTPLATMIVRSGETLVVSTTAAAAAPDTAHARAPIAVIAAPLQVGGATIAILSVEQVGLRRWRKPEVALVEAVAGALARAAERAVSTAARHRTPHPAPRYSAATALIASLELPTTLDSILEHATQMTGAGGGEIFLLAHDAATLMLAAERGGTPAPAAIAVTLPIEHAGQPLGVLRLARPASGDPLNAAGVVGLRQFMRYAASAIANAQVYANVQEANRLKSEFIATVSHELRTPMGAIMGYAELLSSGSYGDLPPSMRDPLLRLKSNADSLLTLINQMLDLSRIEAGRLELHAEPFQPHDLLNAIAAQVMPAPNVRFEHIVTPEVPRIIMGDVGRLRQMLVSLLAHSLKWTADGSIVLVCGRTEQDELEFSVTDTGPGIAPEKLPFVWQPFRQLGPGETRVSNGAGLGLAIVQKLVQVMGGSASVASQIDQGTRFTLRLPLRLP